MAQVEITLRHYSNVTVPVAGTIWDKEQPVSELSAWWESDKEGVIAHVEPDADGLVYGDLALREGIHEVSLVALDPKGDTGSDTVLVIVSGPNSPPQCSLEAPALHAEFARDGEVEMWGTAADIDVGAEWLHSSWSSDVDGLIWEGSPSHTGVTGWITSDLSVGAHTISLTVTDDAGVSCTDSTEIWVGFTPCHFMAGARRRRHHYPGQRPSTARRSLRSRRPCGSTDVVVALRHRRGLCSRIGTPDGWAAAAERH